MNALTGPGTCGAGCHGIYINGPGFALEHYGAMGEYRTLDGDAPIDSSGTFSFADGPVAFTDAVDFSEALARSPQVHACFSDYLVAVRDRPRHASPPMPPVVEQLAERSVAGASARDLSISLLESDVMRVPACDHGEPESNDASACFCAAIGGVVVGLPFLEGLSARRAGAVTASSKFAVFVRQGNGVQQATDSGEPESFWPSFAPGAFTPAALAADTGRAALRARGRTRRTSPSSGASASTIPRTRAALGRRQSGPHGGERRSERQVQRLSRRGAVARQPHTQTSSPATATSR